MMPGRALLDSDPGVVVAVADTDGSPREGVPVYAFDGETYTGAHGTTDAAGEAVLELPDGSYRFRADLDGTHFWSGVANHCALPGCAEAGAAAPGGLGHEEVTIDYTYDPLNRLTAADYASSQGSEVDGEYFHYQYDAVGNRLELDSSQVVVVTCQYNAANCLIDAGGMTSAQLVRKRIRGFLTMWCGAAALMLLPGFYLGPACGGYAR